jgi:hypothetical protein
MVMPVAADIRIDAVHEAPPPGQGPCNSDLESHLIDMAAGVIRFGGGYVIAAGVGAAALACAGMPEYWDLAVAGACSMHGFDRLAEGWRWSLRGGKHAERKRRKYQGEATPFEVRASLSPAVAIRKMRDLAPLLPPEQAYIKIGTTVYRPAQQVAVSRAESIGVFGVPQSIKTALMSSWIIDAPGTVLATSSRGDQWQHTVAARERRGTVHVLDADGYGPGTTLAWNPVAGCERSRVAMRRAGDLMHAAPRDSSGKDKWHEDRGYRVLKAALHAAGLTGGNVLDVRAWIRNPGDEVFLKALHRAGAAPGWAEDIETMLTMGEEYLYSAVTSAEAALGWLDDEQLAAVACPQGPGLDIAAFLREGTGTVYLVGADRPHGSLTPFFTAFASEFLEQARILAESSPGRKLPVPLTIAADEAATTARLDLKRWLPVTAGYNITVIAGFQAVSQIPDYWGGSDAAATILTSLSTKVIAGGFTEDAELARFSGMCGSRDTWRRQPGGKAVSAEQVFPPERIRLLPLMNALVVHRNCKVVQVVIEPVWKRRDYSPVTVVAADSVQDTTEE